MREVDLEALADDPAWHNPAARELALWLVVLAAPAHVLARGVWAARVAVAAVTKRRRYPRG